MSIISILTISSIFATTRYVSLAGSDLSPYTLLTEGAHSIESAISVSSAGDLILVDDGIYVLSSTIVVNIGITIKSINGSAAVIVDGNNAVKCFLISNANAILDGFTIQNANNTANQYGGGINITTGGTVKNCTLKNNYAIDGGGIALDNGGLVENCYIFDNSAVYGGGIRLLNDGEARNCVVYGNTATTMGGGINIWNGGKVKNCVMAFNTAPVGKGSGIRTKGTGKVYNSIIYYNTNENWATSGSSYYYENTNTIPALPGSHSTNCISAVPMFTNINPGLEDFRLLVGSPSIDAGQNFGWMNTTPDLDGNPRIVNGICDMGPYEYYAPPVDTDFDGVPDISDDYPTDPLRAFNNFFPTTGFATLAYEDLWPSKGDYDFNDLVLDYRFKTVTNASNIVVEIFADFTIKAFGAGFLNGFGFQFPNSNVLQSHLVVSGSDLQEGYINNSANGLEQGQSKPTIVVYDNSYNIMEHPGSGTGVNTEQWAPYVTPETLEIFISFTGSYTMAQVDIENFNPFLIINKFRNDEVHLPNFEPTDLANTWQFGYADDDSKPSMGRYYKTLTNLPWAINIPESFDYPNERVVITSAHLKFAEWAESNGTLFTNWYQDLPGYRNSANIYNQP